MARLLSLLTLRKKPQKRLDLASAEQVLRSYGVSFEDLADRAGVPIRLPGTADADDHFQDFSEIEVYQSLTGQRRLRGTYYNQPRAEALPGSGEVPGKSVPYRFDICLGHC